MGRAPCCEREGLKKGPWTPEEDQKLIAYINKNGYGNWRTLPKNAGLQRCGKSCRLRWTNYLRPDIKRGRFTFEEEETIIQLHSVLGNKWSAIAARLQGRTDNEIKNYWNTHIRKRLVRMGIDPVTHSPRLNLLDLSTILNPSLCTNSHSQVNFSRLLGMQNLINPELIRLASSIMSSQHENQENFLMQNQIISENQIPTPLEPNPVQDFPTPTSLNGTHFVPFSNHHELVQYDDVQQFQQNLPGFGQVNDVHFTNYGYYGSDLAEIRDPTPSSDNSMFDQSNNTNNNFSFQSVLSSTRSSSPTLNSNSNSNSNYINSSSTSEDERESYCSLLKFEDNILNVSDYI